MCVINWIKCMKGWWFIAIKISQGKKKAKNMEKRGKIILNDLICDKNIPMLAN